MTGKLKPLHKRLSSARGLLIDWRIVLRKNPPAEDERAGYEAEIARFDDAIAALLLARNGARKRKEGEAP